MIPTVVTGKFPFRSFLATGKQAVRRLRGLDGVQTPAAPGVDGLLLVLGNESADLDSLISSLILSYAWSSQPFQSKQVHGMASGLPHSQASLPPRRLFPIPVLPIERKSLRLRPEFDVALRAISVTPDDLITLDDLGILPVEKNGGVPDQLRDDDVSLQTTPTNTNGEVINNSVSPEQVSIVLVDHNKVMPPFHPLFDDCVLGCIDHHTDEGTISPKNLKYRLDMINNPINPTESVAVTVPYFIAPTGSCTSHIVRWCVDNNLWLGKGLEAVDTISPPDPDEVAMCQLALASILCDTVGMTADYKITEYDRWAVDFLRSRLARHTNVHSEKVGTLQFDEKNWHNELVEASNNLGSLTIQEILERDYKEWKEDDKATGTELILGVSSVTKSVQYLAHKAIQETANNGIPESSSLDPLLSQIRIFCKARNLEMFALMTAFYGPSGKDAFQRQLVVYSITPRAIKSVNMFIDHQLWLGSDAGLEQEKERQDPIGHHFEFVGMDTTTPKCTAGSIFETAGMPVKSEEEDHQSHRFWAWQQRNSKAGRKQVGPLLRQGVKKAIQG